MGRRSNDRLVIPLCLAHHQHGGYGAVDVPGDGAAELADFVSCRVAGYALDVEAEVYYEDVEVGRIQHVGLHHRAGDLCLYVVALGASFAVSVLLIFCLTSSGIGSLIFADSDIFNLVSEEIF